MPWYGFAVDEEEDKQPDWRSKKRQGAEGLHSLEPQKAHPTGEFDIVA